MEFVSDPPIATKIEKMKQRVRWGASVIQQRGIDQTQLVIDGAPRDWAGFSFLVVGDSGSGPHRSHNPQRQIAEQMLTQRDECSFVLHTGDVIYLTGSKEFYAKNFIEPYREFLNDGDRPHTIAYDQMVFNLPFLLVPGNHDYYDFPLVYGILAQLTAPLRRLLRSQLDLDIGFRGSGQGDAYARAFLDYLCAHHNPTTLEQHLDQHYTMATASGRCLHYQPGQFTRLPNRYYTFNVGGIDFFALDSNTFNTPQPLPNTPEGMADRQRLMALDSKLDHQIQDLNHQSTLLNPAQPDEADQLDDLNTKVEQLVEIRNDIQKQLRSHKTSAVDTEQLTWLKERLIASCQNDAIRGRILFFHHPPYVTEATKWHQAQTLAVRYRLRQVLDGVAAALGDRPAHRPILDLVLNGHAHCLEHLQTLDTGHADAHTHWIVCGGSGYSLRRQREEGPDLTELFTTNGESIGPAIATSRLFIGRNGQGTHKRRPYSFLRIDVTAGNPPRFVVRPFVSERYRHDWYDRTLDPFEIGPSP